MRIKITEYHCPHCGKKLPSMPRNDYCAVKFNIYGNPYETCKKCKKTYRNTNVSEPATALTLAQKAPFFITSARAFLLMIIATIFTMGFGLIVIIPVYLLACGISRKYRLEHKNQLLIASRERMKDPEYFIRYLVSSVYLKDKSKLTPIALAVIHSKAISDMEADKALDLRSITGSVIGQ